MAVAPLGRKAPWLQNPSKPARRWLTITDGVPTAIYWAGEPIGFGDRVVLMGPEALEVEFFVIGFRQYGMVRTPLAMSPRGLVRTVTGANLLDLEQGHVIRAIELRQRYMDTATDAPLEAE